MSDLSPPSSPSSSPHAAWAAEAQATIGIGRPPLITRRFACVLAMQLVFGFGWSVFLIQPKFLVTELGASAGTVGRVSAMGGLSAVLAIPLVLSLIDRVGRRPLAQVGALLLALLSVGYMFVDHVGPLVYALQALTGASFVLAFNANITLATDEVPPERLGQAIGILGAANMSMNAVATAVGERVAETAGWSYVFALGAVAATLALALSFAVVEDRSLVAVASRGPASTPQLGRLLPLLGVSALVGATFSAMFTFQQPYAVELGARRISEFFVGFTATAVAVRLLLGSLGDRHGRKRVSALSLVLYGTVALATAKLKVGYLWAYGAAFGLAHGVLYPTLNAYAIEVVSPRERGRVIALYNGAFNVGTALSALTWGALAEHAGYPAVFVSAAVLSYAAVVVLQRSPHRSRLRSPPCGRTDRA